MNNTELSTDTPPIEGESTPARSDYDGTDEKIPEELLCHICKKNRFEIITSGKLRLCKDCHGIITKPIKKEKEIERNDKCECGSGLKAKKCCLCKE